MKFFIRGGKKLSGEITVMGAKNAVLKAMAASLLFETPVVLKNVPMIEDVSRMGELLGGLGASIRGRGQGTIEIDPRGVKESELKKEIAERLRASIVLVGPLLVRAGKAVFPHPGGCVIGRRPIDVFLDGWRAMGVEINENKGNGFGASVKKLRGIDYTFRVVSVSGTETLMMTAALAEGKTVLRNAALEPEIPALASFLNASGARIRGAGTPTIEIEGTGGKLLHAGEAFTAIPDRIEAGSFLILGAALATGDGLMVSGCKPEHLAGVLAALRDAGAGLDVGDDWVTVRRPEKLSAADMQTREYPGFPTDVQAPFTVLMTQAEGESTVSENIFENRFGYIEDLKKMGADILLADPHRITVRGPTPLRGREIESPDLRAGLAFVMAALLAEGESTISNVYQIDRGYEKIDERLRALGAEIQRIE